ncbi:hypothetical protein DICVIV_02384 [Dictyocaulus viviparus]|uniref:Channel protein, hemolysin III family n=1 Tax=Dictyocaulus viviparus TaxID=29172 RepID=A0A0D8Y5K0_DICVI|nr:hypothetical protein DICVIV_02384 [Dictyocaulus viviparus]
MLTSAEIPQLLKRNHIIKGYRPLNQPVFYYYKSAFFTHNELINVWTHFVPVVYLSAFYFLPELLSSAPRLPILVLYSGVIMLLLASSFAHLLHSRSLHDHIFWFLIDFSGIALFGCSIGLQRYSCGSEMSLLGHMTYLLSLLFIALVLQFFSSCYLLVCRPKWPWRDKLKMATCFCLAVWVYVPLLDRYLNEHSASDTSLILHTKAFHWLLISGIFMGGHVPERFAPGVFDIFGYGHQIFHLCINMVAWNICDAAHLDCAPIAWSSPPNLAIIVAFLISAIFIMFTVKKLSKKAETIKYD